MTQNARSSGLFRRLAAGQGRNCCVVSPVSLYACALAYPTKQRPGPASSMLETTAKWHRKTNCFSSFRAKAKTTFDDQSRGQSTRAASDRAIQHIPTGTDYFFFGRRSLPDVTLTWPTLASPVTAQRLERPPGSR